MRRIAELALEGSYSIVTASTFAEIETAFERLRSPADALDDAEEPVALLFGGHYKDVDQEEAWRTVVDGVRRLHLLSEQHGVMLVCADIPSSGHSEKPGFPVYRISKEEISTLPDLIQEYDAIG